MNEKDLVGAVARQTGISEAVVSQVTQVWVDTVVDALGHVESVSIRNFGRFYIREGSRGTRVFKFLPSQRLRKLLGWSSTYRGSR